MKRIATIVIAAGLLFGAGAPAAFAAVSAQVSTTSVSAGGSVTVAGAFVPNAWVTLRVLDSAGQIVVVDAAKADANGAYSFTFKAPANAAAGNLTVLTGAGNDVASRTVALIPSSDDGGNNGGTGGGNTGAGNTGGVNTGGGSSVTGSTVEVKTEVVIAADGRTEARAVVDETQIGKALEISNEITIKVSAGSADQVVAQLSAGALQLAMEKQAVVEIQSDLGTYALPTSAVNWQALAQQLGVPMEQLTVSIKIVQAAPEEAKQVGTEADELGATSVAPVIEFILEVSAPGGKSVEVNDFGSTYVSRSLELTSSSIDPSHTTGVTLSESGELRFVPALFEKKDGTWVAVLKRTGNSLYTVVEHQKTFADIARHWAKPEIEQLASKLIVQGVTDTAFSPDGAVTRAEFMTLLVRALGLSEEKPAAGTFRDVTANAWYAGDVEAAVKAKLAAGYEDGTFRPNQPITRQELAVLMDNALAFAGKRDAAVNADQALNGFRDRGEIADWAKAAAARVVKAGLANGKADGLFVAGSQATRAEATVMIQRLLKYAELMN